MLPARFHRNGPVRKLMQRFARALVRTGRPPRAAH